MTRRRLDAELVRRGLARSREQAAELVGAGRVRVDGRAAEKPATQVEAAAAVVVDRPGEDPGYVSRGGHKLAGALAAFPEVTVAGRTCLDAGASTGGFTDVLLRAGAARVIAVDVGYGQLAWSLRNDPRVEVVERLNIREMTPAGIGLTGGPPGGPPGEPAGSPAGDWPGLAVADLSFISLRLVLEPILSCTHPGADYLLMVKPQFEVGKDRVGAGGVVRDPELRAEAVRSVARYAGTVGLGVRGVTASPLPGPAGNVEYFLWLAAGAAPLADPDLLRAIADGPGGNNE